jgi:hypothetical protein
LKRFELPTLRIKSSYFLLQQHRAGSKNEERDALYSWVGSFVSRLRNILRIPSLGLFLPQRFRI